MRVEINAVGRCTVPFAWGMPETKREELQRVLDDKSIRVVSIDDPAKHVMFCYCETVGVRVLYDEER